MFDNLLELFLKFFWSKKCAYIIDCAKDLFFQIRISIFFPDPIVLTEDFFQTSICSNKENSFFLSSV